MRKWFLIAAVATPALLLMGYAPNAFAGGTAGAVNLSWIDCPPDPAALANRNSTCLANTGTNSVVGSFLAPAGVTAMTGNEMVIDLLTNTNPVPAWWQMFNAGSCRATALSLNLDFTANVTCTDYWAGQASGGVGAYIVGQGGSTDPWVNPQRVRIILVAATSPLNAGPLTEGTEYYSFRMNISNAKTTGAGLCDGCLDPVCLVLNQVRITQPVGVGDFDVTAQGTRNTITWQGGISCTTVPVKNKTWGQIKNLYR